MQLFVGCSPVTGFEKESEMFVADMMAAGVTVATCAKAFDGVE